MLLLPLRWLIWLLALSVPAQASAGAWLRAQGPAHLHLDAVAVYATLAPPGRGHGHAHGHAGSRIAPHEHDPAQAGVRYLSDAGDVDRAGASPSADKASALESPALVPALSIERGDLARSHWRAPPAPAFASVAPPPLYRPPR